MSVQISLKYVHKSFLRFKEIVSIHFSSFLGQFNILTFSTEFLLTCGFQFETKLIKFLYQNSFLLLLPIVLVRISGGVEVH